MPFYVRLGQVPHKRHTQFARPDGALHTEEVIGAEGFSGIASIAYHLHPPTLVDAIGEPEPFAIEYADETFLRHRHFKGLDVTPQGNYLTGRTYVMGNDDVMLAVCAPTEPMGETEFYLSLIHI